MSAGKGERWQTKITSLKEGIHHIYDTKDFYDIEFKVGPKLFKAHKLVLAARCNEFRSYLDPNVDMIIADRDVTEAGFKNLLSFIYKDVLEADDIKSAVDTYLAADHYKMKKLMETCLSKIDAWPISVNEVCTLLNAGLKIEHLKVLCLDFIRENATDVITSSDFRNLNFKSLGLILESGALNDVEVTVRIRKIVEWGANRHRSPVNYELVRRDFLDAKPSILGLLGFDTISLNDVAEIASDYPGLINGQESFQFMQYFSKKDRSLLPEWCTR